MAWWAFPCEEQLLPSVTVRQRSITSVYPTALTRSTHRSQTLQLVLAASPRRQCFHGRNIGRTCCRSAASANHPPPSSRLHLVSSSLIAAVHPFQQIHPSIRSQWFVRFEQVCLSDGGLPHWSGLRILLVVAFRLLVAAPAILRPWLHPVVPGRPLRRIGRAWEVPVDCLPLCLRITCKTLSLQGSAFLLEAVLQWCVRTARAHPSCELVLNFQ